MEKPPYWKGKIPLASPWRYSIDDVIYLFIYFAYEYISFYKNYTYQILVCVTEQHYDRLLSFMVFTAMLFRYKGRLAPSQQKYRFFACRLILYLCAYAVENPEILGFCVSKIRTVRTDNKRVKKIEK